MSSCGSVVAVPAVCSTDSLIRGRVRVTSGWAGSSVSMPSAPSIAPVRKGRCNVAVSRSRSRWNTVPGASCPGAPGPGTPWPSPASTSASVASSIVGAGVPPGPPVSASTAGEEARGAASRNRMPMSGKSHQAPARRTVRWSTAVFPPKETEDGGVNLGGFPVSSALKRAIPETTTPPSSKAVSTSCTNNADSSSCNGSPMAAPPSAYGATMSMSARLPMPPPTSRAVRVHGNRLTRSGHQVQPRHTLRRRVRCVPFQTPDQEERGLPRPFKQRLRSTQSGDDMADEWRIKTPLPLAGGWVWLAMEGLAERLVPDPA